MFHELIYDNSEWIKDSIKKEFSDAKFTDATDDFHPSRMTVDIEGIRCELQDKFYPLAIQKGFAVACFGFELIMHSDIKRCKKWARLAGINVDA